MDKVNTFLGPTADSAIAGLDDASAVVLDEIYPVLNDTVLPAIQRLRDNNEGWSVDVQEKWRYVVFAGGAAAGRRCLGCGATAAAHTWQPNG